MYNYLLNQATARGFIYVADETFLESNPDEKERVQAEKEHYLQFYQKLKDARIRLFRDGVDILDLRRISCLDSLLEYPDVSTEVECYLAGLAPEDYFELIRMYCSNDMMRNIRIGGSFGLYALLKLKSRAPQLKEEIEQLLVRHAEKIQIFKENLLK